MPLNKHNTGLTRIYDSRLDYFSFGKLGRTALKRLSIKISITLILSSIVFSNSLIVSAQVSSGLGWTSPNNNIFQNWNYSSQNQINSSNVAQLAIKWFFPVSTNQFRGTGGEGVTTPILAVNGIIYVITNFHELIAIDGQSGQFIWQKYLPAKVINQTLGNAYFSMIYTSDVTGRPLLWWARTLITLLLSMP